MAAGRFASVGRRDRAGCDLRKREVNAVRRRPFLLVAVGLLFTPIYTRAQEATKRYRVGVLAGEPKTLLESLNELGYVDGRNKLGAMSQPRVTAGEVVTALDVGLLVGALGAAFGGVGGFIVGVALGEVLAMAMIQLRRRRSSTDMNRPW